MVKKDMKKTVCVHPDKDISDITLVGTAIRMKNPILAICYGAQLVNVALDGSLIQDITSEVKTPIIHKDSKNERYTHTITIEKTLSFIRLLGQIVSRSIAHITRQLKGWVMV